MALLLFIENKVLDFRHFIKLPLFFLFYSKEISKDQHIHRFYLAFAFFSCIFTFTLTYNWHRI